MVFQSIRFLGGKKISNVLRGPELPVLQLNDSNLYLIPCLMCSTQFELKYFHFEKKLFPLLLTRKKNSYATWP